jgi:tetratricopeptide (TPR) repeat protein
MSDLNLAIKEYATDTENPEKNFQLALIYDKLLQYAGAISFYLRAAERTENKDLAYVCVLKIAHCFDAQQGRNNTVRGLYKHAMCLQPNRPEAYYFLSRHYEKIKEYVDSYMIAELGLSVCNLNVDPLPFDVGYPGNYGLIFQKAVSAWWWGKSAESRKLFIQLAEQYYDDMDDNHSNAVQNNLCKLGAGPESQVFRMYTKDKHDILKYKFPGSETIEKNYSQAYQDMFILAALNGKRNGTYLEIGSAGPFHGNNTALLEMLFGWRGIGIENNPKFIEEYTKWRKNPILLKDATNINYNKILKELAPDGIVDYLQLDCEPPKVTFQILLSIPLHKWKFAVITFEHDHYADVSKSYQYKSRKYLESMGYELVVSDISGDGISNFEDWWVHPELVAREKINMLKDVQGIKHIEKYFLTI